MSIPKISLDVLSQLVKTLTEKLDKYDDVGKIFMIQYSYFEKIDGQWIFKTFLDVGKETINQIDLKVTNYTSILVSSKITPAYGFLHINDVLDMRGRSTPKEIYACDLCLNFEPKHYVGRCYTC
jgi:hypothetical protein